MRHSFLIAVISCFSLTACVTPPKAGEIVYGRIVQVFSVDKFEKSLSDKTWFKGFFGRRELSMLETAINEGIDIEDIRQGRLVSVDCSCGSECYTEFPLVLPEKITPSLYWDLLEIEMGMVEWISKENKFNFSLAKFHRKLDIPSKSWVRYPGNHERMPACFPNKW